jgi:hypothetical protein
VGDSHVDVPLLATHVLPVGHAGLTAAIGTVLDEALEPHTGSQHEQHLEGSTAVRLDCIIYRNPLLIHCLGAAAAC